MKATLKQIKELLRWASKEKDRKGRSLLERARESLRTGSYLKYNTTVEVSQRDKLSDGSPIIWWDCNCPASNKGRHKNKPCKHVIARFILMHKEELSKNSKWAQWFKELEEEKLAQVPEEFRHF